MNLEKTGAYCLDFAPELRTIDNIKGPNNASENVTKFSLLKTTVFKRNYIHEEIKRLIRCSRGLRRGSELSSAYRTFGSWVRISLGTRTYASDVYVFVLWRQKSCDGPIPRSGRPSSVY